LILLLGNDRIFQIDDFDSFLFDNNYVNFNSHFLNIISLNKNQYLNDNIYGNTVKDINKIDKYNDYLNNIIPEKYIKTNLIINKFFPNKEKINYIPIQNPQRISDWEYEIFIAYKIDESFEYDLLDFNLTNNNINNNTKKEKEDKEEKDNYNDNDNYNNFISSEKLNILQDLIYNKKAFNFNEKENENEKEEKEEKEENFIRNKNSFKVLFKDPDYEFNIRYGDSNNKYTNEEKLKLENGKNLLYKGKCINISNLNISKENLKGINYLIF
jgi:hypothetical protein